MRALRFSCRQKYCYYYLDRSSQGTGVRRTKHLSQPADDVGAPRRAGSENLGKWHALHVQSLWRSCAGTPQQAGLGVCFLPGAKPASLINVYADDTQKCVLETRRRVT
ncbi:hypothetical protein V8C44DRAFT_330207 [Trichoderma aethiopicum]